MKYRQIPWKKKLHFPVSSHTCGIVNFFARYLPKILISYNFWKLYKNFIKTKHHRKKSNVNVFNTFLFRCNSSMRCFSEISGSSKQLIITTPIATANKQDRCKQRRMFCYKLDLYFNGLYLNICIDTHPVEASRCLSEVTLISTKFPWNAYKKADWFTFWCRLVWNFILYVSFLKEFHLTYKLL